MQIVLPLVIFSLYFVDNIEMNRFMRQSHFCPNGRQALGINCFLDTDCTRMINAPASCYNGGCCLTESLNHNFQSNPRFGQQINSQPANTCSIGILSLGISCNTDFDCAKMTNVPVTCSNGNCCVTSLTPIARNCTNGRTSLSIACTSTAQCMTVSDGDVYCENGVCCEAPNLENRSVVPEYDDHEDENFV